MYLPGTFMSATGISPSPFVVGSEIGVGSAVVGVHANTQEDDILFGIGQDITSGDDTSTPSGFTDIYESDENIVAYRVQTAILDTSLDMGTGGLDIAVSVTIRGINTAAPIYDSAVTATGTGHGGVPASVSVYNGGGVLIVGFFTGTGLSFGQADLPDGYTLIRSYNATNADTVVAYRPNLLAGTESPSAFDMKTAIGAQFVTISLRPT